MNRVFLGLGGNLGERFKNIELALIAIEARLGPIYKRSSIYQTKAWGGIEQPDFLNMVVEALTPHNPEEVLDKIQKIETDLGRVRIERWGARVIDIDLLFYNDEIVNLSRLIIPHPLIEKRKFVLLPLAEIAKEWMHPRLKKTVGQLLNNCDDELEVLKLNKLLQ
ncbi:MAG TPA: 2-amino-4-hydroxy-6-hydroxymethyldihydropteridine diphosphokinase [Pelobium sp.]|nr:2-amino-4-hydroxy-6-hydroxymethyldihydropteridine diphosphokinase [Pelobium sp.]